MSHGSSPLAVFHRTGDRSRLAAELPTRTRPALFAPYREIWELRGDFPLLLGQTPEGSPWVVSLTDRIDEVLSEQAGPGAEGEETRRQTLAVERDIRRRMHEGRSGTLGELWAAACDRLVRDSASEAPGPGLERVRAQLDPDTLLLGCDAETAPAMLRRAWRVASQTRLTALEKRSRRLIQRLSDLLRADHTRSPEARRAESLRKAVGGADRTVLDFDAMARILRTAPTGPPMTDSRRSRIQSAMQTLEAQAGGPDGGVQAWDFSFDDCASAQEALRQRLPAMRDLVCAIATAELELENRYDEARHDRLFSGFGIEHLGPEDFDLFPPCLVVLQDPDQAERNRVLALLESGAPFRIVVQVTDLIELSANDAETPGFGRKAQNLARFALGLDDTFVLQAANASLYRLRGALLQGMQGSRPALFSIYAGKDYLSAASAVESRAFPGFSYDPMAGDGQAARFSLAGNPQPESDWPLHKLEFEAPGHERRREATAFTFVDYLAAHPGFTQRFAALAGNQGEGEDNEPVPVADYLALDEADRGHCYPFVLLVDESDCLYRAIADDRLIAAAESCRTAWRSLQELCGVANTHVTAAMRSITTSTAAPTADTQSEPSAQAGEASSASVAPPALPASSDAESAAEESRPADEPWIETLRCTSCNECRQINDRLFGYDADQRAFIADPDAGTYRELVEAAESCQVAIIHPGKPRNPEEPGLEELLRRAEPFL